MDNFELAFALFRGAFSVAALIVTVVLMSAEA